MVSKKTCAFYNSDLVVAERQPTSLHADR